MINIPATIYAMPDASKALIKKSDKNESIYVDWTDLNLKDLYRLYK